MADDEAVEPLAGELTTANYGWVKPTVGSSDDAWGGYINSDLDGIDTTVKGIDTAVSGKLNLTGGTLTGSLTLPNNGAATAVSLSFGAVGGGFYGNAGNNQISVAIGGTLRAAFTATGINNTAIGATTPSTGAFTNLSASGTVSGAGFTSLLAPYALTASTVASFNARTGAVTLTNADVIGVLPGASTTPAMDGTAAVGTGTTWARADHVHPSDTSRYAASNPSGYQTAAQVTASLASYLPLAGGTLTGALNGTTLSLSGGATGQTFQITTAAGGNRSFVGQTNGVLRWAVVAGNSTAEGGSVSGSDFNINSYGDGGGFFATPLSIKRSTSVATFSVAIVNGPSDRTLKENIAPLEGSLDKVLALQGVRFNMIATPSKPEIGLIAQDVQPIVPEVIQTYQTFDADGKAAGDKLALDYPKLTALLIEAVKTLAARVAELEAR